MSVNPARREQVAALHRQGLTPSEIARRIGRNPSVARYHLRKLGVPPTKPKGRPASPNFRVRVQIPRHDALALQAEADERGIPLRRLIRRLINVVCRDQLVSAILDDRWGPAF